VPWEKVLHQWASAKAKLSILNVGVVEDEHTMCDISVVEHAVMVKPQLCGTILGCERLFKEYELSKTPF
jgi:hypothetical protein